MAHMLHGSKDGEMRRYNMHMCCNMLHFLSYFLLYLRTFNCAISWFPFLPSSTVGLCSFSFSCLVPHMLYSVTHNIPISTHTYIQYIQYVQHINELHHLYCCFVCKPITHWSACPYSTECFMGPLPGGLRFSLLFTSYEVLVRVFALSAVCLQSDSLEAECLTIILGSICYFQEGSMTTLRQLVT